jgi:hypothetical protein
MSVEVSIHPSTVPIAVKIERSIEDAALARRPKFLKVNSINLSIPLSNSELSRFSIVIETANSEPIQPIL